MIIAGKSGRAPPFDCSLGAYRRDWLGPGAPTAPAGHRLPLLPSSPGGVHEPAPRGTRPSTPFPGKLALAPCLGEGFHPAMAGCGYRAPPAPRVARPLQTMVCPRFLTVNQDDRLRDGNHISRTDTRGSGKRGVVCVGLFSFGWLSGSFAPGSGGSGRRRYGQRAFLRIKVPSLRVPTVPFPAETPANAGVPIEARGRPSRSGGDTRRTGLCGAGGNTGL